MREIKFRAWDKKNKRWATDYDTIYIADDGRQYIYYDGYDSCLKHVVLEISQYTCALLGATQGPQPRRMGEWR